MIQKRKVKNLISVERNHNSLLTTLLLLVGGVLFIGAIGLLATSMLVKASTITYEGVDNKAEVVFDMSFVPKNKLSGDVVDNMYLTGRTFYISGSSLVLTGKDNTIITGKNINILGGKGMNIQSKNISIIGGSGNTIKSGYDNMTVLGGINLSTANALGDYIGKAPNVFLGGNGSKIRKVLGSAIIGGSNNHLWDGSCKYCFVLGGRLNRVGGVNSIVGGYGVTSSNRNNVFVFSDATINIFTGDAFYFNVTNGVGLGMNSSTGGVSSKGAVSLGYIDINLYRCNESNNGVIGTWDGCLVGCTNFGSENGSKWEMVDHSESCKKKCKDNGEICVVTDSFASIPPSEEYSSYCTGDVNVGRAIQCHYNLISGYDNVVYEKILIGADDPCPSINYENKCVFKCQRRYPNVTDDGKNCTN